MQMTLPKIQNAQIGKLGLNGLKHVWCVYISGIKWISTSGHEPHLPDVVDGACGNFLLCQHETSFMEQKLWEQYCI
jgi:hypothetical protein